MKNTTSKSTKYRKLRSFSLITKSTFTNTFKSYFHGHHVVFVQKVNSLMMVVAQEWLISPKFINFRIQTRAFPEMFY